MSKTIEKLKNCPNCAGILDEVGRCKYCGSKVYDFLTLNFNGGMGNAKSYIRIRSGKMIQLIPITYAIGASFKVEPVFCSLMDTSNFEYRVSRPPRIEAEISFICDGEIIEYEDGDEE